MIHRINSRPPFNPAGTPGHGRLQTLARSYETRHCAHRNTSAGPFGDPSRQHPADAPAGQRMERIPPPEPCRDQTCRDHAAHEPAGQWMHCAKLTGQRLMARTFDSQVAELQVRIAVLNGYTAPGIPITEAAG
ncbi:ISSpo9, transposase [Citreicella sp. SE45]|nr:ISSpo9, transposase [Citreicella sp. SE45]